MRNIYLIQVNQVMPEFSAREQSLGRIDFAFTSLKKANDQMDTIHRLVESGEFYIGDEENHSVEFDQYYNNSNFKRVIRINHSDGTYTMYSIHAVNVNHGYGI